jgi:formylglycine-generating enzyme required for sulfatase activity
MRTAAAALLTALALVAGATAQRQASPERASSQSDGTEVIVAGSPRCAKPGDTFNDCTDCPEMVVVPTGAFLMGPPPDEAERSNAEGPLRRVLIGQALAVGKYEVTFAEWDACVADGACRHSPRDSGWGAAGAPLSMCPGTT